MGAASMSIKRWISNKNTAIYTMGFYSAVKKSAVMKFANELSCIWSSLVRQPRPRWTNAVYSLLLWKHFPGLNKLLSDQCLLYSVGPWKNTVRSADDVDLACELSEGSLKVFKDDIGDVHAMFWKRKWFWSVKAEASAVITKRLAPLKRNLALLGQFTLISSYWETSYH